MADSHLQNLLASVVIDCDIDAGNGDIAHHARSRRGQQFPVIHQGDRFSILIRLRRILTIFGGQPPVIFLCLLPKRPSRSCSMRITESS